MTKEKVQAKTANKDVAMLRYGLIYSCLLLSTYCFADTCPCPNSSSNFSPIQIGDSLEHIKALCCAPLSEKTSAQSNTSFSGSWKYFVAVGGTPESPSGSVELTVSFIDNRVANISVMAQSLASTSLCAKAPVGPGALAPSIKIDDSIETVKSICGQGLATLSSTGDASNAKKIDVTELEYSGPPPVTLRFESGVLKKMESTQKTTTGSSLGAAADATGATAGRGEAPIANSTQQ